LIRLDTAFCPGPPTRGPFFAVFPTLSELDFRVPGMTVRPFDPDGLRGNPAGFDLDQPRRLGFAAKLTTRNVCCRTVSQGRGGVRSERKCNS
jgi:hypothetical protein